MHLISERWNPKSQISWQIYGRNQAGCGKANILGVLPFTYGFFMTSNLLACLWMTICVKKLELSHNMQYFEHKTWAITQLLFAICSEESVCLPTADSSLQTAIDYWVLYSNYCILRPVSSFLTHMVIPRQTSKLEVVKKTQYVKTLNPNLLAFPHPALFLPYDRWS